MLSGVLYQASNFDCRRLEYFQDFHDSIIQSDFGSKNCGVLGSVEYWYKIDYALPLMTIKMNLKNLILTIVAANANLIQNGGFEDHKQLYCGGTWCYSTDNSAIAPWSLVKGGPYEVDSGGSWSAQSGTWSMDLSSDSPYSVAQNVNLIPGHDYSLSYYLIENSGCNQPLNTNHTGYVSATGSASQVFWHALSVYGNNWLYKTYNFTATSTVTSIEFGSTTNGACGPVIDTISLVDLGAHAAITLKCVPK